MTAVSAPWSAAEEVAERQRRMLRTALGTHIASALSDPKVIEIMVNPDGRLWLDRLGEGITSTDITLSAADTERIIRLIAAHVRIEVHSSAPIVSAELPDTGERFEGILPPIVRAPAFSIRKRAIEVMGLKRYVEEGILTEPQAEALRQAVRDRLEHPDRRRHLDGQDDPRQCASSGDRIDQ